MQYNFVILHQRKYKQTMQDITPNNIDMLVSLIGRAEHITIESHMKPDGDALRS